MKTIELLLDSRKISLEELASKSDVNLDRLQRWINNSLDLNPTELRDVATYFGCTVEDLTQENDGLGHLKVTTNLYHLFTDSELEDGFWGHFGIQLYGEMNTRWFPITKGETDRVTRSMSNYTDDESWITIQTLNNRLLIIKPSVVSRFWILDDGQDPSRQDWEVPFDGYNGQPPEFYTALEEYAMEYESGEVSKAMLDRLDVFTEIEDLGIDEIFELVLHTHIYDIHGNVKSYWVDGEYLLQAIDQLSENDGRRMLDLSCDSFDSYFPLKMLSLIDMPLNKIREAYDY